MAAGEIERGFDDGVGKVGDLTNDRFNRLIANDVAVGDAEGFAAFEAAERSENFVIVAKRADFVNQLVGERQSGDRLGLRSSAAGRRLLCRKRAGR